MEHYKILLNLDNFYTSFRRSMLDSDDFPSLIRLAFDNFFDHDYLWFYQVDVFLLIAVLFSLRLMIEK